LIKVIKNEKKKSFTYMQHSTLSAEHLRDDPSIKLELVVVAGGRYLFGNSQSLLWLVGRWVITIC
jgi:hypothetical protein